MSTPHSLRIRAKCLQRCIRELCAATNPAQQTEPGNGMVGKAGWMANSDHHQLFLDHACTMVAQVCHIWLDSRYLKETDVLTVQSWSRPKNAEMPLCLSRYELLDGQLRYANSRGRSWGILGRQYRTDDDVADFVKKDSINMDAAGVC